MLKNHDLVSIPIMSAMPTTTSAELAPSGISSSASFSTASFGMAAAWWTRDLQDAVESLQLYHLII